MIDPRDSTLDVDLLLDVRRYVSLNSVAEYTDLWNRLHTNLVSQKLQRHSYYELDLDRSEQPLGFMFLGDVREGNVSIHPSAHASIYGLLENRRDRFTCQVCTSGSKARGVYHCSASAEANRLVWLCDRHAAFLEGDTRAYHPDHLPKCSSNNGAAADFWCHGPLCRPGRAWSRPYRCVHPRDSQIVFCRECHSWLFPECSSESCARIGDKKCEFVDSRNDQICSRAVCGRHAFIWKLYGFHRDGVTLCQEHRRVATMDDESLVDQMCLATAARKQRRHRHWLGLPTLNTGRHVFLRARNRHYDIETVFLAFQASRERLGTKGRLRREVRRLYDQKMPQWQRELEQNRSACERGKKYLLLVQREYERRGLVAVAKTLSLSDLRVNSEGACVLYLNVAEEKAGLFCGPKHRTRLEVGESVSALLADEGEGVSLEIQLESQYRRPRGRLRAR